MKTSKRILALALCAMLLVGLFPMTAHAAELTSGTCGADLTWVLTDDGVLTISGTGEMTLTEPDWPWENYKKSIQSVVIESGVTGIGNWAFSGCKQLVNVSLPESLTVIGLGAFQNRSGCIYEVPQPCQGRIPWKTGRT